MDSIFQGNRSTLVEMSLIANGGEHKVSRSGTDYLILAEAATFRPGPAVFRLTVDGKATDYPFVIAEDSSGDRVDVSVSAAVGLGDSGGTRSAALAS